MEKPKTTVQNAASCLSPVAGEARKFTAIHAGIALGFSLLITVLNFIVNQGIDTTAGLSGMGMRSVLATIQAILRFASIVMTPFWQISFISAALAMARKESFGPYMLLNGFKRFSGLLMLLFGEFGFLSLLAFACFYICSGIFSVTPLASRFFEVIEPALSQGNLMSGSELLLDEATLAAAMDALMPMLLLFLVAFLVVSTPIIYRMRMADFLLMDYSQLGGIRALRVSIRMMRGQCKALFRLDLQFWWFYVLQVLIPFIGYGDLILPLFGIELFANPNVSYFLFYILYIVAEFALLVWAEAHIQTSYCLFYDELKDFVGLFKEDPRN